MKVQNNISPKANDKCLSSANRWLNKHKRPLKTQNQRQIRWARRRSSQKTAEQMQQAVIDAKRTLVQTRQAGKQTAKTARQAEKTIKTVGNATKSTAKGTIKTIKKSVKTAERTAKTTVKTAQKTAKAAQQSAKTAVQTAKVATKAVIAMVKAAIAAVKWLVALIAAGGWIAVLVIVIICLIGMLVGLIFGIFFPGEDSGNGYTMPMAIVEINTEYSDKLIEIRNENAHDEVQLSGARAEWKEILAVYTVKADPIPTILPMSPQWTRAKKSC
ncbi:MAG: hypothetical protein ACOX8S_07665 [Christensenellales bacterium]